MVFAAMIPVALGACKAEAPDTRPALGVNVAHEFDDCDGANWCSRMVEIPAGSYMMGSPESEPDRAPNEGPQHRVSVQGFAAGKTEITFDQWYACAADGGCSGYRPTNSGPGDDPVVNISWQDAGRYVAWLTRKSGKPYRLLTEAEWEYAARAGAISAYPWGESADHAFANYGADLCCVGRAFGRDQWMNTSPVGSFPPNRFGLYDMNGNAWEWVADCYHDSYAGAPMDGSAWTNDACSARILRGGSWLYTPAVIRSALRRSHPPDVRSGSLGFRVARNIQP